MAESDVIGPVNIYNPFRNTITLLNALVYDNSYMRAPISDTHDGPRGTSRSKAHPGIHFPPGGFPVEQITKRRVPIRIVVAVARGDVDFQHHRPYHGRQCPVRVTIVPELSIPHDLVSFFFFLGYSANERTVRAAKRSPIIRNMKLRTRTACNLP